MKNPELYLSQSEYVHNLKIDIIFSILDNFYYDEEEDIFIMENLFKEKPWKNQKDQLKRPPFLSSEDFCVKSADIEGNEQYLIDYYASIFENAKEHHKTLVPGNSCFWLSPLIYKDQSNVIGFPWHTTYTDAISFLNILQSDKEGWIFDGKNLDWHLTVYTEKEKIYFATAWFDECYEQEEPYWCVSTNRIAVAVMAKEALKRVEKQIHILSQHFGRDYWTGKARN